MSQQHRPIYEDSASLESERSVIKAVERAWGVEAFKLPMSYQLDYALTHGTAIRAFVEVKCRTCTSDQYREYMISLQKVDAAMRLAHVTGLPVLLVVEWVDQMAWLDLHRAIKSQAYKVQVGGRVDRADAADREPVIHFPVADFTRFASLDSSKQAA